MRPAARGPVVPVSDSISCSKRKRWAALFPILLEESLSHYRVPRQISVQSIALMLNALTEGAGVHGEVGFLDEPFKDWARRMMLGTHLVATAEAGMFRNRIRAPDVHLLTGACDSLHKVGAAISPSYALKVRPRLMAGVSQSCVDGFVADHWAADLVVVSSAVEVDGFMAEVDASNEAMIAVGQPEAGGVLAWVGKSLGESANDTNARMAPQSRRRM